MNLSMTLTDSAPEEPRRRVCGRCRRPQSACICRWITPVEPVPEVLILQHPLESRQAKNSALLLHLSLKRSRLVIGEIFGESELQHLLFAPFEPDAVPSSPPSLQTDDPRPDRIHPVLLYPDTPDASHPFSSNDSVSTSSPSVCVRLVVLDGTWRKSRKLLFLNPSLQGLPRMSLHQLSPSRYRIRKAHGPDQLSTLEATCQALMQLEGNPAKYLPLLEAFDGFVGEHLARMPSQTRE